MDKLFRELSFTKNDLLKLVETPNSGFSRRSIASLEEFLYKFGYIVKKEKTKKLDG